MLISDQINVSPTSSVAPYKEILWHKNCHKKVKRGPKLIACVLDFPMECINGRQTPCSRVQLQTVDF